MTAISGSAAPPSAAPSPDDLRRIATRIRHHVVNMCATEEGGHLGGSLSSVDILTALYFAVMSIEPASPRCRDRDIFLLSKGHAAIALYATLAERGFVSVEELATYGRLGGRLMGHPVSAVPGVEMPTGSLGHGLALGLGFALGARLAGLPRRVFVLLGDGELQEGTCWEAAMGAAAQRTDRLVAVVDRNGLQLSGTTEGICPLEPLADRWRSFGWDVREVDGHDYRELVDSLSSAPWSPGRPSVVLARTVKGSGLPFAAGKVGSHYAVLSPATAARARRALNSLVGGPS